MNITRHNGFDVLVQKLSDGYVGVATSPDHVITTTHQSTEQEADRLVHEMIDAYWKPALTERLARSLDRTQVGCTIAELMTWHGTTRNAAYSVIERLMKMGCVRNVPEQVVEGTPGRRGRYWITERGQKALDTYLKERD